jgi:hypothetical protein
MYENRISKRILQPTATARNIADNTQNPVVLISLINSVPTSDTISQWPFRTTTVPQPRVSPCPPLSL